MRIVFKFAICLLLSLNCLKVNGAVIIEKTPEQASTPDNPLSPVIFSEFLFCYFLKGSLSQIKENIKMRIL